jgi:hypothetical protein
LTNSSIWFDGKSSQHIEMYKSNNFININQLFRNRKDINLQHYNQIFDEIDVFKIIFQENITRNTDNEISVSKTHIGEVSKIEYEGFDIYKWFSNIWLYVKTEVEKFYFGLIFALSLLLGIFILFYILIKKIKKTKRKCCVDA